MTSPAPSASFTKLRVDPTVRFAWRFFLGRLMIGGWVLSETQHRQLLKWAADVGLELKDETPPG